MDELLGMSTVSMDFDVSSVEGEAQLQAYMQVQQVPNDTPSDVVESASARVTGLDPND